VVNLLQNHRTSREKVEKSSDLCKPASAGHESNYVLGAGCSFF